MLNRNVNMLLLELFCVLLYVQVIHAGRLREDEIPGEPQLVTVESPSPETITVSWYPPADSSLQIRGYKIGWGENTPDDNQQQVDERTLTTTLTALTPDTQYIVSVQAVNNRGDGLPVYEPIRTLPGSDDYCKTGWEIKDRVRVDIFKWTMVALDKEFSCGGQLTQWTYQGKTKSPFRALVFRPIEGSDGQYKIVGINDIPAGAVDTPVDYTVPEKDRITVQPGDVIGWSGDGVLAWNSGEGTQKTPVLFVRESSLGSLEVDQIVDLSLSYDREYSIEATVTTSPVDDCKVGWEITNRAGPDSNGWTMVSPDQQFSCSGQLTKWTYQGKTEYPFRALVYRPIEGSDTEFKIVGINDIPAGAVDTPVDYTVPESDRITVQPGDVIGWSFEDGVLSWNYGGSTLVGDNGGSQTIESPIVSATATGSDSADVTWTGIDGATDGRSYRLRYKTKPPSRWTSVDTTETSYTVTGLEPDTLYEFAVKVKRGDEESLWSISTFARTDDGPRSNNTNSVNTTCEAITVPMCTSALPYQDVLLPNLLGQSDQGAITTDLTTNWLPIAFSGCSMSIQTFVCVSYLPSCDSEVPLPPCREICLEVRGECQDVIDKNAEFTWPEELACESLPSEADGGCVGPNSLSGNPISEANPPDFCEPVTIAMCEENRFAPVAPPGAPEPEYPQPPWANYTMYPNFLGHNVQGEAEYLTIMVEDVVFVECSPILKFFVCLAVAPMCIPDPAPIPPCKELCEMAIAPCLEYMQNEGIEWPSELACENFPPSSVNSPQGPPACIGFEGILGPGLGNETGPGLGNETGPGLGNETGPGLGNETDQGGDGGPKGPGREMLFIPPDVEEGTATCEPLSDSAKELCPGLEYTETIFPNTLGHGDQEEAYEMLSYQTDTLKKECSIGLFLCVLAFPPCKRYGEKNDSAVPLLPCREECAYTKTSCVDVDFDEVIQSVDKWSTELDCSKYPESYSSPPLCWEITNGFLQPEPEPTEPAPPKEGKPDDSVCSNDISETCKNYGFKTTFYPNAFGHANSTYAGEVYEELQPLIDSMCHPEIGQFICASLFPLCTSTSLMPCHETCRQVWKACKSTAAGMGIDRPKVFSCSKYYTSEEEGFCITSVSAPRIPPKVKSIDRQPESASIVLWPEDENAKFFNTKIFTTSAEEKTFNVSTEEKTTTLTFENLDPEEQYHTIINTANHFGESPSILETIPKHSGIQCQPLEIEMCKGFGYDMTLADGHPNSVGNVDQAEAYDVLQQLQPLVQVGCSPNMQELLCWVLAPGCTPSAKEIIPPCKETCEEARFGCESLMTAFGYQWPEFLECDLFPNKSNGSRGCEGGKRVTYYGENSETDGANYYCSKVFSGPQPTWFDSEGNEIANDTSAEVYSESIGDIMTRLVIPAPVAEENAGKYTCRSGENEIDAHVLYLGGQGTCYDNNLEMCSEFYEQFYLPNSANQTRERDAYLSVNKLVPLMATNCSQLLSLFTCYYFLPNNNCQYNNESDSGRTSAPCSELCYKVQLDCMEVMEEIGFLWPEDISCDSLPSAEDGGFCDNFGVTVDDLLSEGNFTEVDFVTDITDYDDLNATDATDIYPTDATVFATDTTELYTEVSFTTEVSNETDIGAGNLTCAGLKARRYDIEDLGSDCLFRGWADVQAQGAANDYCRVVSEGGPRFLSCALAGSTDDHVYTSPNASVDWWDAGHTDTWYMKDEDGDGRDDYCRCAGVPPDTVVSCMKAGEEGFLSHDCFQIEGSSGCEYNKVNPFFGAP